MSESRDSESRIYSYCPISCESRSLESRTPSYGVSTTSSRYNSSDDIDTLISRLEKEQKESNIMSPKIIRELSRRERLILELKKLREQAAAKQQEEQELEKLKRENEELEEVVAKIRTYVRPTSSYPGWFESVGESRDGESNW